LNVAEHTRSPVHVPRALADAIGGLDRRGLFQTLFAAYHDALVVVDATGNVVLANPSAATLLGYSIEELVGLPVDSLVPDAVRPRHAAFRAAFAQERRPRPMGMQTELSARRKDGSTVAVEIALSPLDEEGSPLVVAAIRDVGAYPRVKQALQRARYSESLAQLGRLAVDVGDSQGLLDAVTMAAVDSLRADAAVVYLLESNLLELRVASAVGGVSGESRGDRLPYRPESSVGMVLAHGRTLPIPDHEREGRFADLADYLQAGLRSGVGVPISDRGRTIGVLAVRSRAPRTYDADELRFLDSLANLLASTLQRAQSEQALSHAQRLESVGQLTGGIAHDFNNLLTVIQGNLQVLEELPALVLDDHARQLVDAAARASRRGAELTSKLLAFSRRQVLQPSAVDVATLLNSLADMLRRTLDQRIRIEVNAAEEAPLALADPGQLEAALLNIAINARDAMPEGGRLHFRSHVVDELPRSISDRGDDTRVAQGSFIAIAVSDSGEGMSEEIRKRAFEPFFTTKAAGRGTGLGLSTVYGFVKQSRGAVALESRPGLGTTVTLYLPIIAKVLDRREEDKVEGEGATHGLRVMLVEDDGEVRTVVHRFLETAGCRVTTAVSGEEAMLALGGGETFDLLVSDIALGTGMRGTELAARVQERLPGIRVLLMSGFSPELLEADQQSPPEWELLPKPFTRGELVRAIARVTAAAGPERGSGS
jgi:PAS domain S-box-containing protein